LVSFHRQCDLAQLSLAKSRRLLANKHILEGSIITTSFSSFSAFLVIILCLLAEDFLAGFSLGECFLANCADEGSMMIFLGSSPLRIDWKGSVLFLQFLLLVFFASDSWAELEAKDVSLDFPSRNFLFL